MLMILITGDVSFVYGSCETRKTYLWKVIIVALRSKGKIILSVASSGIAALLLPFGKTAHAMFKLSLIHI